MFISKRSLSDRFWELVNVEGPDDCWEWTGGVHRHGCRGGYGRVADGKGNRDYSHRVAWSLANGPIPDGMHVLHQCDNRKCCNAKHLHLGTNADNQREKVERGRAAQKLTADDVRAIRVAKATYAALAQTYGVSAGMIGHIINRRRGAWAHLN